jgi:hypothetical protein
MVLLWSVLVCVVLFVSCSTMNTLESLLNDTRKIIFRFEQQSNVIISKLQTNISQEMLLTIENQHFGCFHRPLSTIYQEILHNNLFTTAQFDLLQPFSSFQLCQKNLSYELVDYWDKTIGEIKLNQYFTPNLCHDNLYVSPSPSSDSTKIYGLVVSSFVKLSLFIGSYQNQTFSSLLLKKFQTIIVKFYNTLPLKLDSHYLFILITFHQNKGWKFRSLELDVKDNTVKNSGLMLINKLKLNSDISKISALEKDFNWKWLYSAPECTLLFPSALSNVTIKQVKQETKESHDMTEVIIEPKSKAYDSGYTSWECIPFNSSETPISEPEIETLFV